MTTTPPGWYDDGHGALRWWDGTQWTEHVAQPDPEPSEAPTEAEIVAGLGFGEQEPVVAAQPDAFPVYPSSPEQAGSAAAAAAAYPQAQPPYAVAQPGTADPQAYAGAAYPTAAYPGADAAGGAFAAATEPRTSKLWIVWVVLGVVLLGIVIAAAIVIPLLFLSLSSTGTGTGVSPAPDASAQSADEAAAIASVDLYDDAWQSGDCDALTASTTEAFREANGYTDCAAFEAQAELFDQGVEEYEVQITGVESAGDQITVTTNETYLEVADENGEPIDPVEGAFVYEYTLLESDGAWLIDTVYSE